jgi:ParB family chromosome partitioning protein
MRVPWSKSNPLQLDLLSSDPATDKDSNLDAVVAVEPNQMVVSTTISTGQPLIVSTANLYEDPNNPRTEFPQAELEELAEDIRQHGILQPIVVHPFDAIGRHQIHFGAKRWRAAQLADLREVPVIVRDAPADPYAQIAENQKRHGLTPLDLARFIRGRVDAGESNATVAKRLGMNLTTVAHHLALLELPPELDDAMRSGRITSPRTLHELSKLHAERPEQVRALMTSGTEITRMAVLALRDAPLIGGVGKTTPSPANKLIAQANAACDRLERVLSRMKHVSLEQAAMPELIALRTRIQDLAKLWQQGSDGQTPPPS